MIDGKIDRFTGHLIENVKGILEVAVLVEREGQCEGCYLHRHAHTVERSTCQS